MKKFEMDPLTRRVLYKGIDVGLTLEQVQNLRIISGDNIDIEAMLRSRYDKQMKILRESKINEILNGSSISN